MAAASSANPSDDRITVIAHAADLVAKRITERDARSRDEQTFRSKLGTIRKELAEKRARRVQIEVRAHLAGGTISKNSELDGQIAELASAEEAIPLAIEECANRVQAANDAVAAARSKLAAARLTWITSAKTEEAGSIRAQLAALKPSLERLIGLEHAQRALLGAEFQVSSEPGVIFSGEVLAINMTKALPKRLQHSDLEAESLLAGATALLPSLIQQLKG